LTLFGGINAAALLKRVLHSTQNALLKRVLHSTQNATEFQS